MSLSTPVTREWLPVWPDQRSQCAPTTPCSIHFVDNPDNKLHSILVLADLATVLLIVAQKQ